MIYQDKNADFVTAEGSTRSEAMSRLTSTVGNRNILRIETKEADGRVTLHAIVEQNKKQLLEG